MGWTLVCFTTTEVSPGVRSNIAVRPGEGLLDMGPVELVPELLPVIVVATDEAVPPVAVRVYASILVPAATAAGSIVTVKLNVWVLFPKPLPPVGATKPIVVSDPDSPKVTVPELTPRAKALNVLSPSEHVNPGPLTIATVVLAGQSAALA